MGPAMTKMQFASSATAHHGAAGARSGMLADLILREAAGTRIALRRGAELYVEGDESRYCYKVVSGAVRRCKLMIDGRRHIASFHGPGELLGFAPAGHHDLTAEAITDTVVLRYPRAAIESRAERDPGLARELRSLVCRSLVEAHERMLLLGCKSAAERVAAFLIERADAAATDRVELPMPRHDVADYLGLTIETVSRVLGTLKRSGVIAIPTAQRIDILDREALAELDCAT